VVDVLHHSGWSGSWGEGLEGRVWKLGLKLEGNDCPRTSHTFERERGGGSRSDVGRTRYLPAARA
jgi:hypothetical protein